MGCPPSRTSTALVLFQPGGDAVDRLAVTDGVHRGPHHRAHRLVERLRVVQRVLEQLPVGHRSHHLGQGEGRLGLDHRDLGDPVLLEQGDGRPDGLFGVDVDERGVAVALGGQHGLGGLTLGPSEPVVCHPPVVVELGEIAPTRVGDEDDDDIVGTEVLTDVAAPPTPRSRKSLRR